MPGVIHSLATSLLATPAMYIYVVLITHSLCYNVGVNTLKEERTPCPCTGKGPRG